MASGNSRGSESGDWQDHVLWQLNGIRQAVTFIAVVIALGLVLSFMLGAAA